MRRYQRRIPNFKFDAINGQEARQGLTRLPRKGAEAWPARCGGDFRSPRKPAGPDFRQPRSSAESPAAAPSPKTTCRRPIRAKKKRPKAPFFFYFLIRLNTNRVMKIPSLSSCPALLSTPLNTNAKSQPSAAIWVSLDDINASLLAMF